MIIAISGHRPNKLFGYDLTNTKYDFIRNELKAILQELKATTVSPLIKIAVSASFVPEIRITG